MSFDAALARVQQLQALLYPQPVVSTPPSTSTAAPAEAPASTTATSFASRLQSAGAASLTSTSATTSAAPTSAGQAILNIAKAEVGVAEQPPGSNDSPRIAQYRQATAGSGVGPWCAYFTSWAARQAGVPLGDQGQGFGSVSELYSWAQQAGKAIPNGPGVTPQTGDLIVWGGEHIGIVDHVDADGTIHTVEGNSSDQVAERTYKPGERPATGYVRLG